MFTCKLVKVEHVDQNQPLRVIVFAVCELELPNHMKLLAFGITRLEAPFGK